MNIYDCQYMLICLSTRSSLHTNNNISMPPSSRKRNKGKERKAKQQAKKEENERSLARKIWRKRESSLSLASGSWIRSACNHGCTLSIPDDHPVSSFMDHFYTNVNHKNMTASQNLKEIFTTNIQIWDNKRHKKIVLDIGTNLLLGEGSEMSSWPLMIIAQSILVLEHYEGTNDLDSVLSKYTVVSKWRDLQLSGGNGRRDALKFYRKRISACKCLKQAHLEARKTVPRCFEVLP